MYICYIQPRKKIFWVITAKKGLGVGVGGIKNVKVKKQKGPIKSCPINYDTGHLFTRSHPKDRPV